MCEDHRGDLSGPAGSLCPAGGVHAGGGLRPGSAPVRRGGGAPGPGHPGGVGAGPELSPDGPGRLSGLPRPDAGHHPDGGHKRGGDSRFLGGAGGGHGTYRGRRDRVHDGGPGAVPDHGGGGAGGRPTVRGCTGGGSGAGAERQRGGGDHPDPHRLPGGDHRVHQSGALHRRQRPGGRREPPKPDPGELSAAAQRRQRRLV